MKGAAQWQRFDFSDAFVDPGGTWLFGPGPYLKVKRPDDDTRHRLYPRIEPKMRLWVRETWRPRIAHGHGDDACDCADVWVRYEANGLERFFDEHDVSDEWNMPKAAKRGNVSPLFMPRWASRITLEVTGVRVERLQEISEEDAKAEGVATDPVKATINGAPGTAYPMTHRQAFVWLWDSINGERASWASNPWVWVVEFRRVEKERAR